MIEKRKVKTFFMILERKLRNHRQIPSEDFFLEITRFLRQKLNSFRRNRLSYLRLEIELRFRKC